MKFLDLHYQRWLLGLLLLSTIIQHSLIYQYILDDLYLIITHRYYRRTKKIHNLKLSKNVAIQTAPQIRLIQSNDKMPADKIQMVALSTVPLWESQIKIALGLHRQEGRAARQSAETDLLRIERQLKKALLEAAQQ